MKRILLDQNVFDAAQQRIEWVFDTLNKVCVSFSGGKDSTVLLHLAGKIAKQRKRKITILFVDWEVQFSHTIDHVLYMKSIYTDVIEMFYWIALPLLTVSGISWEPGKTWVRSLISP